MWPVSASTSYLLREPSGTSTKTITSVMVGAYGRRRSRARARPRRGPRRCPRRARSARRRARRRARALPPPRRPAGSARAASAERRDALEQELEERLALDLDPHVRVRLALGPLPEVDDGAAP